MSHLRLIGKDTVVKKEHFVQQLSSFYSKLLPELKTFCTASRPCRFVAFQAELNSEESLVFMGIESAEKSAAFDLWTLENNQLTTKSRSKPLKWLWQAGPEKNFLGEFAAQGRVFKLIANFYSTAQQQADFDNIRLLEYDPRWQNEFAAYAKWFSKTFAGKFSRLEHYGSTAIPGMTAKPVIDILVGIDSFDDARKDFLPEFNNPAHEYWWYFDHMVIIRRNRHGKRTHHIHFATPGHRLWDGVKFRDYLISHPAVAAEYARLKDALARQYPDQREKYTEAKTSFIRKYST